MSNINYIKPNKLEDFSVWCSKKYPLWYKSNFPFIEDTFEALDTYGLICKIVQYLNETKQNLNTTEDNVQNIYDFVSNYFENLDVQKEINKKLDEMIEDGTFESLTHSYYSNLRNIVTENPPSKFSAHFSFDDVAICWTELQTSNYSSLWDHPFFGMLKNYHDNYGACFSLYVFYQDFSAFGKTNYINDFKSAKNWLKIGIHSKNDSIGFDTLSYPDTKQLLENFKTHFMQVIGDSECMDIIPRLDRYASTISNIKALGDYGIIGLLDRDDSRISYQHNPTELAYLDKNNSVIDKNNMMYFKTNLRVESSTNLTNDLNDLIKSINAPTQNIEIFTHEWQVYSAGAVNNTFKQKIDTCIEWIYNNNITFNFIQNKIQNHVSKNINKFYLTYFFVTSISQGVDASQCGYSLMDCENETLICNEILKNHQMNGFGTFSNVPIDSNVYNKRSFINKIFMNKSNKIYVYTTKSNLSIAVTQYNDNISYSSFVTTTPATSYVDLSIGKNEISLLDTTKYCAFIVKHTDNSDIIENGFPELYISNVNMQ